MAKKIKEPKVKAEKEHKLKKSKAVSEDGEESPFAKEYSYYQKERITKICIIVGFCLIALVIIFSLLVNASGSKDVAVSDSAYYVSNREKSIQKGNGLVAVTIPENYLPTAPTEQLTQEQKDQGFNVATINDDKSVTYTIEEKAYKSFKKSVEDEAKKKLDSLAESNTVSIKNVEYNSSLTKVTITVDRAAFEGSTDRVMINDSFETVGYMQAVEGYAKSGIFATYTLVDRDTNEAFKTLKYPDALNSNL